MADMRLLAAFRGDWTAGQVVDGELAPDRVSRFCERKRCCRTGETEGIQVHQQADIRVGVGHAALQQETGRKHQ
jgi:hypothetical protein